MSITSSRVETITFAGDIDVSLSFAAADNSSSPGSVSIYTLTTGANTITLPTGGSTPKGATLVPPSGNTQTLTLKGVSGDTGITLHKTNPTTITFDATPPANFILTAGGTITGLRIVWT